MATINVEQPNSNKVDISGIVSVNWVNGTGKTSGKKYQAIELVLDNGYSKLIFLDRAEQFMFNAYAEQLQK